MKRLVMTYLPKLFLGVLCALFYCANINLAEDSRPTLAELSADNSMEYNESNSAGRELGLSGCDMTLGAPASHIAPIERTVSCGRSFRTTSHRRLSGASTRKATQFCKSGKFRDINQVGRVIVLLWLYPSDLYSPQSMLINLRRLRL